MRLELGWRSYFVQAWACALAGALVVSPLSGCFWNKSRTSSNPGVLEVTDQETWESRMALARGQRVLAPNEPYWPYLQGTLYASVDSLEYAEAALYASLAVNPTYTPALSLLSKLLYDQSRHEEAATMLEGARFSGTGTFPVELIEGLALHYEALGDPETARMLVAGIDKQDASVPSYVLLRGDSFMAAAEPAQRAVSADSRSAVNQNNYGITCLHDGDPKKAREAFMTAAKLDPELPGPLYNLALVEKFYFMNDDAAREWFGKYLRLSQEDPDNLREELADPDDETAAAGEGN
jgi:tetratricopeptide (TPR) repeat protein